MCTTVFRLTVSTSFSNSSRHSEAILRCRAEQGTEIAIVAFLLVCLLSIGEKAMEALKLEKGKSYHKRFTTNTPPPLQISGNGSVSGQCSPGR